MRSSAALGERRCAARASREPLRVTAVRKKRAAAGSAALTHATDRRKRPLRRAITGARSPHPSIRPSITRECLEMASPIARGSPHSAAAAAASGSCESAAAPSSSRCVREERRWPPGGFVPLRAADGGSSKPPPRGGLWAKNQSISSQESGPRT